MDLSSLLPSSLHARLLAICFVVTALGCALFYDGAVIDPVLIPRLWWMGLCLTVMGVLLLWQNRADATSTDIALHKLPLFWCLVGYWLISIAYLSLSINFWEGVVEVARISLFVLFSLLISQLVRTNWFFPISGVVFNLLIVLISAIAAYQQWYLDTTPWSYQLDLRIEAVFANINILAFAYVLMAPFAFWWAFSTLIWQRLVGIFNCFLVVLSMLFLKSTGAQIAFGLLLTTVFLLGVFRPKFYAGTLPGKLFLNRKLSLAILAFGLVGVVVIGIQKHEKIAFGLEWVSDFDREEFLNSLHTNSSLLDRTLMLHNSLEIIEDNFPNGIGTSNWPIEFQTKGIGGSTYLNRGNIRYMRPHNDFLWVLSELGIPGFLAFAGIFIFSFWATLNAIKNTDKSPNRLLLIFFAGGLMAYAVGSFFYFPKERVFSLFIFSIYIGTALGLANTTVSKTKRNNYLIPAIITTTSLISVLFFWNRWQGEKAVFLAQHARKQGNWPVLEKLATKAIDHKIMIDPSGLPLDWYLGVAYQQTGNMPQALRSFQSAKKVNPYHVTLLNDMAGANVQLENKEQARALYLEALALTPCYPDAARNLAVVLFQEGKVNEAWELIARECMVETFEWNDMQPVVIAIFREKVRRFMAEKGADVSDLQIPPEKVLILVKKAIADGVPVEETVLTFSGF